MPFKLAAGAVLLVGIVLVCLHLLGKSFAMQSVRTRRTANAGAVTDGAVLN